MSPSVFILIALLKTSGEGGTVQIPYESAAACQAAGARLEAQFEALVLEDGAQNPVAGHPRAVWTCFESPVEG